ncbi:hypothetical protein [Limimaricola sp.]|uniref:hypothetical protein n=1 Tax=Limimaricola sp. TaxID=2211665 RepID=UPI0040585960
MAELGTNHRFRRSLLYANTAAHIFWAVLFFYLIWAGPFSGSSSWLDRILRFIGCDFCLSSADSIQTAYQMGRLELVSLSLTMLGSVVAIGAFSGFFLIRGAAMSAAADESKLEMKRSLPALLQNKDIVAAIVSDERLVLTLANEVKDRIKENDSVRDSDADEIARAFDE